MLLGFIPGTSFAKFNSSYTTFMKYCKGWNDEDMRIQRLTENQELRDSHMKRYLAMNSNDWAKDNVVPNPLNDIFNFVAGGGSDTTSYTLACAFFYILSPPEIYAKLVKELDENARIYTGYI
ncbi:hypothetical protein J3459_018455 [Metarhizium acridum]|nr:hypothetical protein J3459_018455 [Metarhizium acridum]